MADTQQANQTVQPAIINGRRRAVRMSMSLRIREYIRRNFWATGNPLNSPSVVFATPNATTPSATDATAKPQGEKVTIADDNVSTTSSTSDLKHTFGGLHTPLAKPPTKPTTPASSIHGLRNDCKLLDARYTKRGDVLLTESSTPFASHAAAIVNAYDEFADYALVVTRRFSADNQLEKTELKIQSPHVLKALHDVVKVPGYNDGKNFYPDNPVDVGDGKTLIVNDPPALVYHYRRELDAWANDKTANAGTGRSEQERLHVSYLLTYLQLALGPLIKSCEDHLANGLLRFEHLFMVFRPGDLVYESSSDQLYFFRSAKLDSQHLCMTLECEGVSYDGGSGVDKSKKLGKVEHKIMISMFGTTRSVTSLTAYPVKLHPERKKLEGRLKARAQRFLDLRGVHVMQHVEKGRVVVDCKMFMKRRVDDKKNPMSPIWIMEKCKCLCGTCAKGKVEEDRDVGHEVKVISEREMLLCPSEVRGFNLGNHRWEKFRIDDLAQVQWTEGALGNLVMEDLQKKLILGMVQSPVFMGGKADDVLSWKGQGLVVLLHGNPGTGKTLTAECICEHLKRPLYLVSAGELGEDAASVDRALKNILDLSCRWNAIILLDEADVFLEERNSTDIARNNLVAGKSTPFGIAMFSPAPSFHPSSPKAFPSALLT